VHERQGRLLGQRGGGKLLATLEHEILRTARFATHAEAHPALFEFIEVWYNRQRRHTSLGALSPACYEALRLAA
jgi:transposase InsO family protein